MGSIVHKWFEEGLQKGIQRGKMEGIQEGMQKGIITVAKRMLKERQDPDFIVQVTGLSKQQVLKLKSTR